MARKHVIVVVALLVVGTGGALLVNGIMKVREAAACLSCHSNFKGLAVSLHWYAASGGGEYLKPHRKDDGMPPPPPPPPHKGDRSPAHGTTFPAGTIPHATLPPEQRLSWYVALLPYIEQDTVFKQIDLKRGPGDPNNEQAVSNRMKMFVCPSTGE